MEKSSKRGKIPQSDWPLIMARYEAGETLASIARTYDCSPPAISYVVSRSRTRQSAADLAAKPPATEPQLIKLAAAEADLTGGTPVAGASANRQAGTLSPTIGQGGGEPPRPHPPVVAADPDPGQRGTPPRGPNGFAGSSRDGSLSVAPARAVASPPRPTTAPSSPASAAPNGDQRRTLHLSLGNNSHGHGGNHAAEAPAAEAADSARRGQPQPGARDPLPEPGGSAGFRSGPPEPGRAGAIAPSFAEREAAGYLAEPSRSSGTANRRDGRGPFIDRELRARVDSDIAAFLAAFDAALLQDTPESRSALREATDRLLRAGARTRIELERLEARLPLSPRDGNGHGTSTWRNR
jgi:hypothetical protein